LAASPWALYTLVLRDKAPPPDFVSVPLPVAFVFVLVGLLGFLVVMMFIQVRFTIILYMRAMNEIRGHFSKAGDFLDALRLPVSGKVPHYYENGSYILLAIIGMALVNALYVAGGIYRLCGSLIAASLVWAGWLLLHLVYYRYQAGRREKMDLGRGELKFKRLASKS
jgi:hypothetical protein